jgi:hypothetical protein
MVEVFPVIKSERYIKTMEFFNQLREPEKSQAIANYDENYEDVIPDKLCDAVDYGFNWATSPERHNYWENICGNIRNSTYLNTKEAVHCPTQEEFDYVTEKLGYEWISSNPFDKYTTDSCIKIGVQCYGEKSDFEGYVILSFQEWCTENDHDGLKAKPIKPAKGMHVRCLIPNNWADGQTKVGQVLEIEYVDSDGDLRVNGYSFDKSRITDGDFELLADYKEEPYVAQVGDWVMIHERELPIHSNWLGEEGRISHQGPYKVTSIGTCNIVTKLDDISTSLGQGRFRKATQAEIDSVTKSAIIGADATKGILIPKLTYEERNALPNPIAIGTMIRSAEDGKTYTFINDSWNEVTEPQWTHDNWYVEVSSQEEADIVIEAANKMYGETSRSNYIKYTEDWKYVSWYNGDYFGPLNTNNLSKSAKQRPISDFITVSDGSMLMGHISATWIHQEDTIRTELIPYHYSLQDIKNSWFDKPYQQYPLTPSESFKVKSNPKLLDNKITKISSINISLKQKSKTKKL